MKDGSPLKEASENRLAGRIGGRREVVAAEDRIERGRVSGSRRKKGIGK